MIKIAIAGDFCPRHRLVPLIKNKEYEKVLGEVKAFFNNFDLSIVNLEAPCVTGEGKAILKDGPSLKCTEEAVEALQYAGVDVVTLANNHLNDYGAAGVLNTIKTCEHYNIGFVGAGANEQKASEIYYQVIKGKRLAIINCCEHEFSIATNSTPGANHISSIKIYNQISEAKNKSDYIVVITHGGHEHYQLPSPRMKELFRFFIDAGADAVVNHHQHCISGYEIYKGKPIAYGIGNFCFDRANTVDDMWNDGMIACLELQESNVSLELKPFMQCSHHPVVEFSQAIENRVLSEVASLSEIIADDDKLQQMFQSFVATKQKQYTLPFEPYGGRILSALYRKKLLPSFLSKKKSIRNYGFMLCESHFDIVKYWLAKKVNKQ